MNPVLRKHLEEAKRAHKITFDVVEDWDALQDLSRLADIVTQAETAAERAMVRPCVTIGNVTVYRPTIGSNSWVERVTKEFSVDDLAWIIVMAFSMAHAKTPRESLWPLFADKDKVQSAIDEWASGIGVDFATLQNGILAFLEEGRTASDPSESVDGTQSKSGFGRLVDVLCSEYGKTPEHWLWDVPLCDIEALMASRSRRIAAQSTGTKTDPDDPRVQASHKLYVAFRDFVERVKAR